MTNQWYILVNRIENISTFLFGNLWEFVPDLSSLKLSESVLREQLFAHSIYLLSSIAWLIAICTLIIITIAIILLRKQRKTQKMLRELNEKLDKLQPPSDPGELNTEDTESAE